MTRPQPFPDAAIRARVVIHETLPPSASIFLRRTPEGQYRWLLDAAQRNVRLLDETFGQVRELGKYHLVKPLVEGDRVLLELRATGDELIGSINGAAVVRAHGVRKAGAGLWGIAGDSMWLDAVEVWEPKPDTLIAAAATPAAPTEPKPKEPTLPQAPVAEPAPAPATPAPIAPAAATPMPVAQTPATPTPATPAPVAQSSLMETAKWLADMDAQWQAVYQREVAGPFDRGVAELRRQHLAALESPLAAATRAKRNDEVVAWQAERDQVSKGSNPSFTDDATTPAALQLLRANFRAQFARLDQERFERARALFAKCDDLLARNQAALVQRQHPDDAASLQKERAGLRAAWLQPPIVLATVAPPRAIQPPPAPSKITSQQIAAKLIELGASVWVKRGKADPVEIKSETEVDSDEKLVFTRVEFQSEKRDGTPLVAADYAILDSLSDVSELVLRGLAANDSVMEKLRPFRALQNLTLDGAKPSPASYAVLPALPELRELQLRDADTTDDGIKSVLQCRKLQRLHLMDLPITDSGLADIGKLNALEELELTDLGKLGSPALAHLVDCHLLKNVKMSGTFVLSGMLEHLAHCKSIESLDLSGTGLKDADIASLSTLGKLKALNLAGSGVTGDAFASWPQRHEITSLNLSDAGGVNDIICKSIEHTFSKLQYLSVKLAATGFSSEGASALSRLRDLRNLRLDGDGIDDAAVGELAHAEMLNNLSITDAQVTAAGVASLARLAHLGNLDLDFPPVTDAALKAFARCKALKTVHIGKDAVPETEASFLKSVPGVKAIRPED